MQDESNRAKAGKRVAIVTGGNPLSHNDFLLVGDYDLLVAADSGLDHAHALGLHCDVVVGDMDSVTSQALHNHTERQGAVESHPKEKDKTDLELAIICAIERGASSITIVGGTGSRVDHTLANLCIAASDSFATVSFRYVTSDAVINVVRPHQPVEFAAAIGETVSLIPIGGPALGVSTSGLGYPLRYENLRSGSTRGISNEVAASPVAISIANGALLVIRPVFGNQQLPEREKP